MMEQDTYQPLDKWFGYKRGDLFKKVQQHNWDVDLSFVASQDDFRDVQVITLQQHLYDLAVEHADDQAVDLEHAESYIDYLLQTQYHSACEFVDVKSDKIVIGINKNKIDERAVDYAKTLLIQVDCFEPGTKRYFGGEIPIYDTTKNK